jgi:hypothetical protein
MTMSPTPCKKADSPPIRQRLEVSDLCVDGAMEQIVAPVDSVLESRRSPPTLSPTKLEKALFAR